MKRFLFLFFFFTSPLTAAMQTDVLEFWFKGDAEQPQSLWWNKDLKVDEEVTKRFQGTLERAKKGDYDDWMETPEGALALILLLDQFPRHIYRDRPEAFAYDAKGQQMALEAIRRGYDRLLTGFQPVFLYMPLQHSEEIHVQEISVLLYDLLRKQDSKYDGAYDYAVAHRDIIKRFGRFPHRNAVLGRRSTDEETEFLKQPGSSF